MGDRSLLTDSSASGLLPNFYDAPRRSSYIIKKEKLTAKEAVKRSLLGQLHGLVTLQQDKIDERQHIELVQKMNKWRSEPASPALISQLQAYIRFQTVNKVVKKDHWKAVIEQTKRRHFAESQFLEKESEERAAAAVDYRGRSSLLNHCSSCRKRAAAAASRVGGLRVPKACILSVKGQFKRIWDVLVLLLSLEHSFVTPLKMAFNPEFTEMKSFKAFDFFVDEVFLVDMLLMFISTFINKRGEEIWDSLLIAKHYIKSFRFLADFLAILSLLQSQFPIFRHFGIFKVARILRLSSLISKLNVQADLKAFVNFMKLVFYLFLWFHLMTCVWFWVVLDHHNETDDDGLARRWYPPTDWMNFADSSLLVDGEMSLVEQYCFTFYHAVLMIGNNELGPVNVNELVASTVILLLSSVLNAHIFGEMAVVLSNLMRKQQALQRQIDLASSVILNIGLPKGLGEDIREFFNKTQPTREAQQELDSFFDNVAPIIKQKIQAEIFTKNLQFNPVIKKCIRSKRSLLSGGEGKTPNFLRAQTVFTRIMQSTKQKASSLSLSVSNSGKALVNGIKTFLAKAVLGQAQNPRLSQCSDATEDMFEKGISSLQQSGQLEPVSILARLMAEQSSCEDFLSLLVHRLGTCLASPEESIIIQGSKGDDMYFIQKGDCAVMVTDQYARDHLQDKLLSEGDHFGEVSLLFGCPRTATVISRNYNTLARLQKDGWRDVLNEYPHFKHRMKQFSQTYDDVNNRLLLKLLRKVPIFSKAKNNYLHELAFLLKIESLEHGELLLKEKQKVESLHFIVGGTVEVFTEFEGEDFILERLHPESIIHHHTFFTGDLSSVSLRSGPQGCKVLSLRAGQLEEFSAEYENFGKVVAIATSRLINQERTFPLDYLAVTPALLRPRRNTEKQQEEIDRRRNVLKSVCFRRILDIRINRKKPKLSQLLKKLKELGPRHRSAIIARFNDLYRQDSAFGRGGPDRPSLFKQGYPELRLDPRFDCLNHRVQRANAVLTFGSLTLEQLNLKMSKLLFRRREREEQEFNSLPDSDDGQPSKPIFDLQEIYNKQFRKSAAIIKEEKRRVSFAVRNTSPVIHLPGGQLKVELDREISSSSSSSSSNGIELSSSEEVDFLKQNDEGESRHNCLLQSHMSQERPSQMSLKSGGMPAFHFRPPPEEKIVVKQPTVSNLSSPLLKNDSSNQGKELSSQNSSQMSQLRPPDLLKAQSQFQSSLPQDLHPALLQQQLEQLNPPLMVRPGSQQPSFEKRGSELSQLSVPQRPRISRKSIRLANSLIAKGPQINKMEAAKANLSVDFGIENCADRFLPLSKVNRRGPDKGTLPKFVSPIINQFSYNKKLTKLQTKESLAVKSTASTLLPEPNEPKFSVGSLSIDLSGCPTSQLFSNVFTSKPIGTIHFSQSDTSEEFAEALALVKKEQQPHRRQEDNPVDDIQSNRSDDLLLTLI